MSRVKYILILTAVFLLVTVLPVNGVEELITRSYLFKKINAVFQPLNQQLGDLQNKANTIEGQLDLIEGKVNKLIPLFDDVPFTHWAANDIYYLVRKKVVSGYTATQFKPQEYVTRAQLAVMLVRAKNLPLIETDPGFIDVKPTQLEYKYIATAKNAGIINGYIDGTFKPNQRITRGQMAKMIVDAFDLKSDNTANPFTDVSEGYLFTPWVKAIAYTGVSTGYGNGIFKPEENTTRAQVSAFIARAIDTARRVPLK